MDVVGGVGILVLLAIWLLLFPTVAAVVAPDDRRWTFFWITLFFLGPFGIAAAAIAQPRPPRFVTASPHAVTSTPTHPRRKGPPPEPIDLNLPPLGTGNSPADILVRHMRKGDKRDQ